MNDAAARDPSAGLPPAPRVEAVSHVPEERLDPRRFRVFGLTWLSYAAYYLTRKNFALAKTSLKKSYGVTNGRLGDIDSAYSAAYAAGQFFWGWAADRIGPRRVLGLGMLGTAMCSIAFGMSRRKGRASGFAMSSFFFAPPAVDVTGLMSGSRTAYLLEIMRQFPA